MIVLLSPAKSLDYETKFDCSNFTIPHFKTEIAQLIANLKNISAEEIAKLMKISPKLAELNFSRFQNFEDSFDLKNSRQALLAFDGDVYTNIDKQNFTKDDFDFAQNYLRILSGLYGILKPLDLIQPYRLEMGLDLKKSTISETLEAKNLYQFWNDKISIYLNGELKNSDSNYIINLASEEYFSAVKPNLITAKIINISFKEQKGDKLKIIGISSKRARGLMTNFIIKNKITNPEMLKKFSEENYHFEEKLSDDLNFIFTR